MTRDCDYPGRKALLLPVPAHGLYRWLMAEYEFSLDLKRAREERDQQEFAGC